MLNARMGCAAIVRRNATDPEPRDRLDRVWVGSIRLLAITSELPEVKSCNKPGCEMLHRNSVVCLVLVRVSAGVL